MIETEIKILNINKEQVERALHTLGAEQKGNFFIVEKAFDFPKKSGMKLPGLLRLRKVNERVELCFKEKILASENFKIQEETETTVENFETTVKIFTSMGLEEKRHREKRRISYVLENTKIEIDEYPHIPVYMEIEGTEETIPKVVALLGYSMKDTCTLTASEVIEQHGQNPSFLIF